MTRDGKNDTRSLTATRFSKKESGALNQSLAAIKPGAPLRNGSAETLYVLHGFDTSKANISKQLDYIGSYNH